MRKTKEYFIVCPLCNLKLHSAAFLPHMANDHDMEAKSVTEIDIRIQNMGFDKLEILMENNEIT